MSDIKNVPLPDIGDFDEVEVIEILVSIGDTVAEDDGIITLESDKASMEIPAPSAGIISEIKVSLGDKIKQGDIILSIESEEKDAEVIEEVVNTKPKSMPVVVPDIGDFDEVEVIEILVNVGDELSEEDGIITLESDKASMEIPTPLAGIVLDIKVALGDKIKLGDLILNIESTGASTPTRSPAEQTPTPVTAPTHTTPTQKPTPKTFDQSVSNMPKGTSHASPSIRKLARELGVDLSNVSGTGQKGRVLEDDLKGYVKQIMLSGGTGGALPKTPVIDFSKFGETETLALSRINKLSGKHLTACWLNIPHVTQFDEVNIDKMEVYRQAQKAAGVKLTPLVFIMKGVVQALQIHPRFNASLDESGEHLILKKYFNLGIAMDTPNGLVVPVIRDVEQKSLQELATELAEISAKARDGKLKPADMQGAGFTISSLGGIGGTQFTPIVNAPEVAILGVSRSFNKPIWNGENFTPELTLPLALSYDHRVIDGAQGGRFMAQLNTILREADYD
ncbi:dihydrolipoyllysine-residue acetyltransferase [Bathymodiolus septemdierum thioautotrophic gill symbiont]|uniref:Dihydrolipoamide acetyltransferase component of pyruvate dehydrogenase complex n=1 Tax=endosymbiont of Bathymodiolus septemdierum str. Myojin knoll TaxID=1303921 RepID=A0A0P0UQ29_9GAMM|nr:dihydrolipoyllysine-residue acetyltransferase [Bathymodiolus septemdierum thioautotrophic gill symbiont]BAS67193.1 pyruvate dehydrogenase E2 component, dihydrolipoamide acetyltransferase [endosymbiont of Bathymodiolus septemdierum str. Myojin knoll]